MSKLSHFNARGEAHMVAVGEKPVTERKAIARGCITMLGETLKKIRAGDHKKGDVLGIARIAAIQAAKKTPELIPLCHPIPITGIEISFTLDDASSCVWCQAEVSARAQTGVEMEALTAVEVGLLTIYDMCKAIDRAMVIDQIQLLEKSGGKSGHWKRGEQ